MTGITARLRIASLALAICLPGALAQNGPGVPSFAPFPEPENHTLVVERLLRYHDSGQYDTDIRQVANSARDYLAARAASARKDEKLAAVFDIDETSLSNWEAMSDCGFCAYKIELKLYSDAHDPAIAPILELFDFARSQRVAVFFVTGRKEDERELTVRNLKEAGYEGWTDLLMQPVGSKEPAHIFKPRNRRTIASLGYRIVLNIGDQASDLAGCCAERVFKLPNPFYLIP